MSPVDLALISDTHLPQRLSALPEGLESLFAGAHLILHAGDAGSLGALDRLGRLAPVVAVRGGDDGPDAARELPQRLVLGLGGRRVLLWHGHFDRPADDFEHRQQDAWRPRLDRLSAHARAAGADVLVYGHTHVPSVTEHQGVWLINPGALAARTEVSVQTLRTVARLRLSPEAPPAVTFHDVDRPAEPVNVDFDWTEGYLATVARVERSIFLPERRRLVAGLTDVLGDYLHVLGPGYQRAAHRVWAGQAQYVTWNDLHREWAADPYVPEELLRRISPGLSTP